MKLKLPLAALVVLLLGAVIPFSIMLFNSFADYMMRERIEATASYALIGNTLRQAVDFIRATLMR